MVPDKVRFLVRTNCRVTFDPQLSPGSQGSADYLQVHTVRVNPDFVFGKAYILSLLF